MVIGYYQGRIVEASLPLVPHKFLANRRDSEFAFRSHLSASLPSIQILGWEGNYTILWVYEKLPTCIWTDCLYCHNMLWAQGLKSSINPICFLKSYFPLILSFTCIVTLFQFSWVKFSRSVMSDSLRPHESQHARPPCPSPTPGVHSDSHLSSQWRHPAISSSVVPFSFCPQSLPASESFPMSQLFTWGGQSTGVLALASVLPKKSQG